MSVFLDVVSGVLLLAGSALALTAAIGVIRFTDTLARMHSATKPQVAGLLLALAGASLQLRDNSDVGMLIVTGVFAVITAPVIAHRVGRLAYREQELADRLVTDELEADAAVTQRGLGARDAQDS
ncbi:monovalent cation/H(+) antiporter subunit G [Mycobacterium simiae]|uniref:Monovalent cation/H(+) antiporter subunit G n=1 Tax=Mycobacterium simiae TaxID=1784 RepID=A0A5B1BVL9_MYCSI|nr:monovalent cation/H(+) antiporter subunit G [Mycobacterium simiae]KAA1251209.1 monovalent cation/H(+) antiporter subunit G [Mycobacterium simiae]